MSESADRYRVVNQRDQPVELHCGGRIVVLAARAVVELGENEVLHPQLQSFGRRGLISIQLLPEVEPEQAAPAPTARKKAAATKTAATPTRQASSKARGGKAK